jgi:hypothetical protein
MSDKKYHLFFSVKQEEMIQLSRAGDVYYEKADGSVVKVSEVIAVCDGGPIPQSNWDDARYLGIGTHHHGHSVEKHYYGNCGR